MVIETTAGGTDSRDAITGASGGNVKRETGLHVQRTTNAGGRAMATVTVETLKVGDVILPPARELSLWMRRDCAAKGLPESALHLTVKRIGQGTPDKRGPWTVVVCDQSPAWLQGRNGYDFIFKARPWTPWVRVQESSSCAA